MKRLLIVIAVAAGLTAAAAGLSRKESFQPPSAEFSPANEDIFLGVRLGMHIGEIAGVTASESEGRSFRWRPDKKQLFEPFRQEWEFSLEVTPTGQLEAITARPPCRDLAQFCRALLPLERKFKSNFVDSCDEALGVNNLWIKCVRFNSLSDITKQGFRYSGQRYALSGEMDLGRSRIVAVFVSHEILPPPYISFRSKAGEALTMKLQDPAKKSNAPKLNTPPPTVLSGPLAKKLNTIIIPRIDLEKVALPIFVKFLGVELRRNDPEGLGVNLLLNVKPSEERMSLIIPRKSAMMCLTLFHRNFKLSIREAPEFIILEDRETPKKPFPVLPAEIDRKLLAIRLPEVEFQETTLEAAVNFLNSEFKQRVPEIRLDPGAEGDNITLSLTNISGRGLLDAVCLLSGMTCRADKNAIVIYSPSSR